MDKFSAKCSELARARRVASDGAAEEAAEEIPSAAEVTSVTSVDVGSEKHARSSEELGYKKGRALKDSRVVPSGKRARGSDVPVESTGAGEPNH